MTEDVLLIDVADGVAIITLNRPQARNALSGELLPHPIAARVITAANANATRPPRTRSRLVILPSPWSI